MARLGTFLLATAAAPMLSGCFFVFIPGALIDQVAGAPHYCVVDGSKVGDRFNINGTVYSVTKVVGPSPYYCREQPESRRIGVDAAPV